MSELARVRVADLPTLATRPRPNLAKPSTRVELKAAKDKSTDKAWEECKSAVWKRDQSRCRRCGRVVVKSLEIRPDRGEVHHISGRGKSVFADPRNAVLVCALPCHQGLTHHEFEIIGPASAKFTVDGRRYLDATSFKLKFIKKEAA